MFFIECFADGQCEPDVVMKKFIDVVKTKDIQRFSSTAGILGKKKSIMDPDDVTSWE